MSGKLHLDITLRNNSDWKNLKDRTLLPILTYTVDKQEWVCFYHSGAHDSTQGTYKFFGEDMSVEQSCSNILKIPVCLVNINDVILTIMDNNKIDILDIK
jgi:hypothetical protein